MGSGCLTIVGATVGGIGADLAEVDPATIERFRKVCKSTFATSHRTAIIPFLIKGGR